MKKLFENNPFAAALLATTAALALAALYFAYAQNASLVEQTEAFSSNTASLARLQSAKPFPNDANLNAAKEEAKTAGDVLGELAMEVARQSAPVDPGLTPRDFQDKLSSAAAAVEKRAGDAGIGLPEDFYLGFSAYKAEPPPEAAAPALGQQLETISTVADILLKSGIRQVLGIARAPLPTEGEKVEDTEKPSKGELAEVHLAPFDVEFVADPSTLRVALSAIVTAKPLVLVRLVSVANSNPSPPGKEDAGTAPKDSGPPVSGKAIGEIPVVFGKETLNVKLRLASLSLDGAKPQQ